VIAALLAYLIIPLIFQLQRRILWRVRRRLVLSYVFIGLIPVVLVGIFFVLAGILTLLSASAYLVNLSFDDLVDEARISANGVVAELRASNGDRRLDLEAHLDGLAERHPDASMVLVGAIAAEGEETTAGPWQHGPPPTSWPEWLGDDSFSGLVLAEIEDAPGIVARAGRVVTLGGTSGAIIVDLPVGESTTLQILDETGVQLGSVTSTVDPAGSRQADEASGGTPIQVAEDTLNPIASSEALAWFSFLEHTNWRSGETEFLYQELQVRPRDLYARVFGAQARIGDVNLGYAFLVALAAVAALFLIIELMALIMGLALARSITGAVHELFVGTEHVRRGNLEHRIDVPTRDQLGELAQSFNSMTGSVQDSLTQAAEKRRLEEELRIAREIQMSLLPRDEVAIPGVTVTATCVPAREVGGDYYDFIRLGPRRLGILIADVSGKGTSAAFYMAELKGLVLALGQIYQSPKQLLIEVNRIMAANIDARSFITMIYAVLDMDDGTLTYARAGHTPLIYLRGKDGGDRIEVLSPSGLVVGLDGFDEHFDAMIEEASLDVAKGDVAVLFTDGVSEAMNEDSDLFGEERLSALVEESAGETVETLRERILLDLDTFVGKADQHDDMTLVLLKIEEDVGTALRPVAASQ
jgi:sigma-B regulation protein RsbU (phosphoserine phosphatase)